jgi:uncharacterized protein (TIGR02996 family)
MLLRAIVEEPESDDLRLIYADWLQDHGDPTRAEFIRLQVRLAEMSESDPERPALEEREQDLLADHRERWLRELPDGLAPLAENTTRFRRGFLAEATVEWQTLVERGAILRECPVGGLHIQGYGYVKSGTSDLALLERVRALRRGESPECPGRAETVAALARCPFLEWVRRLDLRHNAFGPDHLATLFRSPHLRHVTALCLDGNFGGRVVAGWPGAASLRRLSFLEPLVPRDLAALAASPHLGQLRALNLFNCGIETAGVRALVESPTVMRPRDLMLSGNNIDASGMGLLASWSGLAEVERLSLGALHGGPAFTDDAMTVLASSPHLTRLRFLHLGQTVLGPDGLLALGNWPVLARLHSLGWWNSRIGRDGARHLAGAAGFRPVSLALGSNNLGAGEMAILSEAGIFERVRDLDLGHNDLGPAGVAVLVGSPRPALRQLNLPCTKLGDEGVIALAEAGTLPGLRELDLVGTGLGVRGVEALARSPLLAGLRRLRLGGNKVTDAGARALATSPYLNHLRLLSIGATAVSQVGLQVLWERFGDRVYPRPPRQEPS